MKKSVLKISFQFIALLLSTSLFAENPEKLAQHNSKLNQRGISFTENKGQVHDQNYKPRPDVLFGAMAGNMAFHLKTTGVSYQLYRVDKYKDVEDHKTKDAALSLSKGKRKEINQQTIYRIDLNWVNANTNALIQKEGEQGGLDLQQPG